MYIQYKKETFFLKEGNLRQGESKINKLEQKQLALVLPLLLQGEVLTQSSLSDPESKVYIEYW